MTGLADAADEAWELPAQCRVGIVHRLDLPEDLAARWGEVFADYQILQPFEQLGRETYAITEEEKGARELRRVARRRTARRRWRSRAASCRRR